VLGDSERVGDLARRHAFADQLEYLQLPAAKHLRRVGHGGRRLLAGPLPHNGGDFELQGFVGGGLVDQRSNMLSSNRRIDRTASLIAPDGGHTLYS
jgi:hypothetical protein